MSQKLIAIDLDGTTLNNQSQISSRTKEVLQKASQAGHYVSIATGRPYRMSAQFYQQLALNTPMVNFNGSLVHLPGKQWKFEREASFNREIALDILANKDDLAIEFLIAENRETFFLDQLATFDLPFFTKELYQPTSANLLTNLTTNPTSLLVKTQHDNLATLSQQLKARYHADIDIQTWGGPNAVLEIVPQGMHKAEGLKIVADALKIDKQNIVAFGDEHNDLEMLDYAGWGVAMQNGTDAVKAVANDVTTQTNDDNGLANYLEQHLNLA